MKYSKILLPLIVLFVLNGCLSGSSSYYVLSIASQPEKIYPSSKMLIGVEKVTVPDYLNKRDIVIAESKSKIKLLNNAHWGEDLDEGLTSRLISFLQKKFNQPNVYAYPWGVDNTPTLKVKVDIRRFIAQDKYVYLDASFRVVNMKTHFQKAKLFHTAVPTQKDANSIVSSMDTAFTKLEEAIVKELK